LGLIYAVYERHQGPDRDDPRIWGQSPHPRSRSFGVSPPFFAAFVEGEGDLRDHNLARLAIGTEVKINGND
jgi:hypothetical protein